MKREINYKTMRVVVGVIAILLAPAVWMLSGFQAELESISGSYWTDARDVFVGALVAVGFFLLAYNGQGEKADWEFYLSKAACLFAACVALFPTADSHGVGVAPTWTVKLSGLFGLHPGDVHYAAAALLFACLVAMMWFFSFRALRKGKRGRAMLYRTIAILMVAGIACLYAIGHVLAWGNTLLIVEIWGLLWFGIGWLSAGTYKTDPALVVAQ